MRAINHLIDNGVVNMHDISAAIKKEYGFSSNLISTSKKSLRELFEYNLGTLNNIKTNGDKSE